MTPQQELFAQADAYWVAGLPKKPEVEKSAIDSTASDLANSPKVSRRLAVLRAQIQEEA